MNTLMNMLMNTLMNTLINMLMNMLMNADQEIIVEYLCGGPRSKKGPRKVNQSISSEPNRDPEESTSQSVPKIIVVYLCGASAKPV